MNIIVIFPENGQCKFVAKLQCRSSHLCSDLELVSVAVKAGLFYLMSMESLIPLCSTDPGRRQSWRTICLQGRR